MTTFAFWILLSSIWTIFFLSKKQSSQEINPPKLILKPFRDSQNAVFSEAELYEKHLWIDKLCDEYYTILQLYDCFEYEELRHFENCKSSGEFKPSDSLSHIKKRGFWKKYQIDQEYDKSRRMVEANIQALNGKSIDDAQKSFDDGDKSSIGVLVFQEDATPIKKQWDDFVYSRKETWGKGSKSIESQKISVDEKQTLIIKAAKIDIYYTDRKD